MTFPAIGETWRRKDTGTETVILAIDPQWEARRGVTHRAGRMIRTEVDGFLRKYEPVWEYGWNWVSNVSRDPAPFDDQTPENITEWLQSTSTRIAPVLVFRRPRGGSAWQPAPEFAPDREDAA